MPSGTHTSPHHKIAFRFGSVLAAAALVLVPAGSSVANTTGSPGTPSAPVSVYTEDFENVTPPNTAISLQDYVGASGLTYTADPGWLPAGATCNGLVVSENQDVPAGDGCAYYAELRQLAGLIGTYAGVTNNHVVSAYTGNNPGPDNIQFKTNSPIPLSTANRFITFSVDTAETSCQASHAALKFYLLDGTTETPTFTTPIDPCGSATTGSNTGSFAADNAVLFSGSELGIVLRNGNGGFRGNDVAFDNIKVLDATPQLDTSFGPDAIVVGETSTLTFTITNTSELAEKDGWSFDGALPAGVTVAGTATTTCGAGTITAASGDTSVSLSGGNIAAGVTSCTVTVLVTAAEGTYTLHPADLTVAGLDLPADATLTVGPVVGGSLLNGSAAMGLIGLLALVGGVFAVRRRSLENR